MSEKGKRNRKEFMFLPRAEKMSEKNRKWGRE